ncbi:hypothetical protein MRX96_049615 [Rhipicephalus microplus]
MRVVPGREVRASGDQVLAVSPATPPIAAKMAAVKANFSMLAKLVADVLVSDDDDGEMSDLQSEEELEETSDLTCCCRACRTNYQERPTPGAAVHIFWGDAAYPLLPWLLPPYRHVTSSWQPWMSKFNHVHCKRRVVIVIAFGLLKERFRRLDKIDVNSIPQAVEIVMAACVLHNLARRRADVLEDSDIANSDLGIFSSEPVDVDHKLTLAARLRDRLAHSVPL